ncbi:hypothetical protein EX30DRAFT_398912 [Ascodesmis nigricans]|uniref:Mid2 domain-containing protein n=1 Tax=Ascodesmis nigricans TaxID=341454 RepID=A0A4V3SHP4_9PEZI|nr:hypothetical protein EX30DRAFT_398912 [Ascodesmis nigricans]
MGYILVRSLLSLLLLTSSFGFPTLESSEVATTIIASTEIASIDETPVPTEYADDDYRKYFTTIPRTYSATDSIVIVRPKSPHLEAISSTPSLRTFANWKPNSNLHPDIPSTLRHFGNLGSHSRPASQRSIDATFIWFAPKKTTTTARVTVTPTPLAIPAPTPTPVSVSTSVVVPVVLPAVSPVVSPKVSPNVTPSKVNKPKPVTAAHVWPVFWPWPILMRSRPVNGPVFKTVIKQHAMMVGTSSTVGADYETYTSCASESVSANSEPVWSATKETSAPPLPSRTAMIVIKEITTVRSINPKIPDIVCTEYVKRPLYKRSRVDQPPATPTIPPQRSFWNSRFATTFNDVARIMGFVLIALAVGASAVLVLTCCCPPLTRFLQRSGPTARAPASVDYQNEKQLTTPLQSLRNFGRRVISRPELAHVGWGAYPTQTNSMHHTSHSPSSTEWSTSTESSTEPLSTVHSAAHVDGILSTGNSTSRSASCKGSTQRRKKVMVLAQTV